MSALLIAPFIIAVLPALVVPIIIYVIWNVPRVPKLMSRQKIRVGLQKAKIVLEKHWAQGIVAFAITFLTAAYFLEGKSWFLFWVATISGNWTKDNRDDAGGSILFAISITAAIILNIGQFATVVLYGSVLFKRLVKLEKTVMSHITIQGLLAVQGASILTSAYRKIDDLGKDETVSRDLIAKMKRIVSEAVGDKEAFWASLQDVPEPGDEKTKLDLRRAVERGTVQPVINSLDKGPS